MKRNRKQLDAILDNATAAVRQHDVPEATMADEAADRVWARVADQLDATPTHQHTGHDEVAATTHVVASAQLRGCADFQTLIPFHLRGELSASRALLLEDHTGECIPCRKALKAARRGDTAAAVESREQNALRRSSARAVVRREATAVNNRHLMSGWPVQRWAIAATLLVAFGLAGLFTANRFIGGNALAATVESTDGALYLIGDAGNQPLAAGAKIKQGEQLRAAKDSDAVLRLADGSRVELRERAEVSLSQTSGNTTVHLDRGDVIVDAPKAQTQKQLYIETSDALVSVAGTISSVNSGTKGSRVSVVEGEARFNHAGSEQVLRPGEQATTRPGLERVPVKDEIAWSRNAARYAQSLAALGALRQDLQHVARPGVRYSTRFLDLAPTGTVLYAALPNLSATLAESHRIMQERVRQNPALSEWLNEGVHGVHNNNNNGAPQTKRGPGLDQVIARVKEFGAYLGDEIVVTAGMNAQGEPDGFLVFGELKDAAGFRPYLEKQLQQFKADGKNAPAVRLIDDPLAVDDAPATAATTSTTATTTTNAQPPHEIYVWINSDFFAAAPNLAQLRQLATTVNAPAANPFVATPFHARLADVYREGAGLIVAADLQKIIAELTRDNGARVGGAQRLETYRQLGLLNLRYFVVEQKEVGAKTNSRAVLTFAEPRRGLASWLAAPAPMGALNYISRDANVVAAFVVKEPKLLVDDLLGVLETAAPDARRQLQQLEAQHNLDLRRDFAAPLGGEFAFAVDGPVLPTPSWKMVFEVYDQARLQATFERVVEQLNAWAAQNGKGGLRWERADSGAHTFYTLRSLDMGLEVNYVYAGGYLIAAPSRVLVERALQFKDADYTLLRSPRFTAALPADGNVNFSALFYHDLAPLVQPFAQRLQGAADALPEESGRKAVAEMAAGMPPTLAYVYAQGDRITLAANTEGGPFGLSPASLLGLPNAFAMQHIMTEAMGGKNAPQP